MNKCILVGRLCKDVELKIIQNNSYAVVNNTLACKNKNQTIFINVVFYASLAEKVNIFYNKGDLIALSGFLQNQSYFDENNTQIHTIKFIAERIEDEH